MDILTKKKHNDFIKKKVKQCYFSQIDTWIAVNSGRTGSDILKMENWS